MSIFQTLLAIWMIISGSIIPEGIIRLWVTGPQNRYFSDSKKMNRKVEDTTLSSPFFCLDNGVQFTVVQRAKLLVDLKIPLVIFAL